MKTRDSIQNIKDVNFSDFRLQRKEISVNGKSLPLAIGDRVILTENDKVGRTVMGITIQEDGRIVYMLEWLDPATGTFATEQLTLTELKLLNMNIPKSQKRKTVGFSEDEA